MMFVTLNTFISTLPASNAAIKNTASTTYAEGLYPAYSATGQDVWLEDYRYDCRAIIVSAVGARCGKCFKADGKWNVCANTHILFVDETIANRDYIWYLFNNENWWIKGGSAQPFVKVKESLKRKILLPNLDEQNKIVEALDKISNSIKNDKKTINRLESLIHARFLDLFGNPIINSFNWDTKPINEITPVNKYKGQVENIKGKVWLLNLDMVESNTGRILDYLYVEEESVSSSTIKFDENCVLYSKLRPYLNKVVVPNKSGYATSEMISLNTSSINKYFLATLLRLEPFVNFANGTSYGAKMPRASVDEIKAFNLICPPVELQNDFAKFVLHVESMKEAIYKRISLYEELLERKVKDFYKEG